MLRTIRTYRKSLFGVLGVAAVVLVMTGFGINFVAEPDTNYAIKIDDLEIPFRDFERQRRAMEQQYRRMLGKNFDRMGEKFLAEMNAKLIDSKIADALIERQAREFGMFVSDEKVAQLFDSILPPGWTASDYENLLQAVGMSAPQFERQIATDALRAQFVQIIEDASFVPEKELRALVRMDETKYDIEYLAFKPSAYTEKVEDPDDEVLLQRYEDDAYAYEAPAKVEYNYVVLEPADARALIEVFQDDIELYYVDNQSEFTIPAQIKASHIQLNFPNDADEEARESVKAKAEEVASRAAAGEDFTELVKEYSEDFATKNLNGNLGWISPGKMSVEFDKSAFELEVDQVSEPIKTSYGYHIVKLEDKKAESVKELDEVKEEIVNTIKDREAPAYLAAMADEILAELDSGETTLEKVAEKYKKKLEKSPVALSERMDPRPSMRGLTKQVISNSEEKFQRADLEDQSVLVEVTKFSESQIEPFEKVKSRVLKEYKQSKAKELAQKAAQEALEKLSNGELKDLAQAAESYSLKTIKREGLTRPSAAGPIFSKDEVKDLIFKYSQTYEIPKQVVEADNSNILLVLTAVHQPSGAEVESKLQIMRARKTQENGQILNAAIVNKLKFNSKIDVDDALHSYYAEESDDA